MAVKGDLSTALLWSVLALAGIAPLADPAAAERAEHRARVVTALAAAGYSYMEVEEQGRRFWVSTMETAVAAGETIEFPDAPPMENFTSKSLKRHFDRIMFVPRISKAAPEGAGTPAPPTVAAEAIPAVTASAGGAPSTAAELTAPQTAKLPAPGRKALHRGVVTARLDGGGLVFLEVREGAGRQWVAVSSTKARPGDPVQFSDSPPVAPFTSAALGKTFASVAFPDKVTVAAKSRRSMKQD